MDGIVLLNNDHTFLSVIEWESWEKAIRFVVKGKAQVVKNSHRQIRYGKGVMYVPKVLRMIYQVIKSSVTMKVKYT